MVLYQNILDLSITAGAAGGTASAPGIFCEISAAGNNIWCFTLDNCLITLYNYFVYCFVVVIRRNVYVIDNL